MTLASGIEEYILTLLVFAALAVCIFLAVRWGSEREYNTVMIIFSWAFSLVLAYRMYRFHDEFIGSILGVMSASAGFFLIMSFLGFGPGGGNE